MKYNVLVFPCGTEVGLEISRSLKFSTHIQLFGASSVSDHGLYEYMNYTDDLPFVEDENFIQVLNKVIEKNKIDFVFPAHDAVVLKLAQQKNNLKCDIISSPLSTCEISRSKKLTYEKLVDIVPTPKVYDNINEAGDKWPCFMKPNVGQGSRGVHIAHNQEEALFYKNKNKDLLLTEFLPGDEYTVDCFTNKNGELLFSEGRSRKRISNGISVHSEKIDKPEFSAIAKKMNDALEFRGVWFFQLKARESGELVLMEFSPRTAGTMGLVRCKGVNLPLLSVFDAADISVSICENEYSINIDRALSSRYKIDYDYDHIYVDLDDTIIFNDKVNPSVVSLMFQAINEGKKIHLITRHENNLDETLSKFRISDLFDEIITVDQFKEKSDYIKHPNSIFIDDSFAERENVQSKIKIPVFDAHMLEGLIK